MEQKPTRDHRNDFDLLSDEFNENYSDVIDDLIAHCPVARSNVGDGYYVVTRYDDVAPALRDWHTFGSAGGVLVNRPSFEDMAPLLPTEMDPPDHTIWRTAMMPHLTAGAIRRFEDEIRRVGNDLVDQFIDQGECDFARAYSKNLPGRIFFTEVLGTPVKDMEYLQHAMDEYVTNHGAVQAAAYKKVTEYIDQYLRDRSSQPPRGDVVDAILSVDRYSDGSEVPFGDKVGVTSVLLSGGLETAANTISGAMYHFATHPGDFERVVSDPALLPVASEELLRAYASTFAITRTVTEDTEIQGCPIKKGERVMFAVGATARDPARFPEGREVVIDRKDNRHVIFGVGPHRCIGSHLARREMEISIDIMSKRFRNLRLNGPIRTKTSLVRIYDNLPIKFDRAD